MTSKKQIRCAEERGMRAVKLTGKLKSITHHRHHVLRSSIALNIWYCTSTNLPSSNFLQSEGYGISWHYLSDLCLHRSWRVHDERSFQNLKDWDLGWEQAGVELSASQKTSAHCSYHSKWIIDLLHVFQACVLLLILVGHYNLKGVLILMSTTMPQIPQDSVYVEEMKCWFQSKKWDGESNEVKNVRNC